MLKRESDILREFPVVLRTNRDCENPSVIEFVKSHPDIESLIDVGAHNSWANYAPEIRKLVKRYYAVDILDDPETKKIVDSYYIGNANEIHFGQQIYDCVISVSVFEHCGISTYTADHKSEVIKLFETCLMLSKKYVWISCDIGLEDYVTEGQHCPITLPLWNKMLHIAKNHKVTERFFYSQGPQAGHMWLEHAKKEVAFKIPYISYIGNQSIGVLEIEKL